MENFRENLLKVYEETNAFGRLNGMELVRVNEDNVEYRMKITKDHLATPTTAHGGAVAGYMDGILGVAALNVSAENACLVSTVEFKINYLSPVFLDDVLIGKGTVVSHGNRIIVTQAEIINEKSGHKVAIATGTFNAYPYEKSGIKFENFDHLF